MLTSACASSASNLSLDLLMDLSLSACSAMLPLALSLSALPTSSYRLSHIDTRVCSYVPRAYKLVVAERIPEVSYLMLLDKYLLTCYVLMALVVVEGAVGPYWPHESVDAYLAAALLTVFVLFHLYSAYVVWCAPRLMEEVRWQMRNGNSSARRSALQLQQAYTRTRRESELKSFEAYHALVTPAAAAPAGQNAGSGGGEQANGSRRRRRMLPAVFTSRAGGSRGLLCERSRTRSIDSGRSVGRSQPSAAAPPGAGKFGDDANSLAA